MIDSIELYEIVVKEGIEHDTHQSGLYFPVNERTNYLTGNYEFSSNVTKFRDQISGNTWYCIPFANKAYLDKRKG